MTPIQIVAHDLADTLLEMPASMPDRRAVMARSIELFAEYAISNANFERLEKAAEDLQKA